MTKIAINGFGRIGRAAFKIALQHSDVEIVGINDLADIQTLANLLAHDSNYGTFPGTVKAEPGALIVNGNKYPVSAEKDPAKLPWGQYQTDVVLECTGRFRTSEQAQAHIQAGAKLVIISAPAEGGTPTVVRGVNNHENWSDQNVVSNASCTTNCLTPIASVINDNFGIAKALMSTIHSYTADQVLVDGPHKDPRRARSAAMSIIPTSTGAATATTDVIPELKGLFDGLSFRVPTPVVSLSDITFVTKKPVTVAEVNAALTAASQSTRFKGILAVTTEELVSIDYKGNPNSCIVDLPLTQVVGGDLVKVVAWYDNEWGYSNRLVELAAELTK